MRPGVPRGGRHTGAHAILTMVRAHAPDRRTRPGLPLPAVCGRCGPGRQTAGTAEHRAAQDRPVGRERTSAMARGGFGGVVAALTLGAASVVAGCDGDGPPDAAPATAAASHGRSDAVPGGAGLDDCRDGRCEIVVTAPTRIPLDDRLGVDTLRISRTSADTLLLQASGPGTQLATSVGEGGTGVLNGLGFRVKDLDGTRAVVVLFPRT
ncbi:hypothetical protein GCM10010512_23110 [Streptomyces thermoviolaceus subsp. thermoviolaceus]|nr:hypothetical protein GCM10010512_23110 [Streptomyces thermoviolaceus subsp. thermoviolaceus]